PVGTCGTSSKLSLATRRIGSCVLNWRGTETGQGPFSRTWLASECTTRRRSSHTGACEPGRELLSEHFMLSERATTWMRSAAESPELLAGLETGRCTTSYSVDATPAWRS